MSGILIWIRYNDSVHRYQKLKVKIKTERVAIMNYQNTLNEIKKESLEDAKKIEEREIKQKKRKLIGLLLIIIGVPMILCYGIGIIMIIIGRLMRNKANEELTFINFSKLHLDVFTTERVRDEVTGPIAAESFGKGTFSNEMMSDVMQNSNVYIFSEVTCGDGIQGYYDDIAFRIGAVTITEIKRRKEEEKKKNHFEGNAVQIPIKKTLSSPVYVMPKFGARLNDYPRKLLMDNSSFNNIYDVYTADNHSAFQILTPSIMEKLAELAGKFKLYAIIFTENRVVMLINENPISYYRYHEIENISLGDVHNTISDNAEIIKSILNNLSFLAK